VSLEAVFLREVLDRPDDDTPRLVYADWLEEHGDEIAQARAELIRAQCELERLPEDDPARAALARRCRELLRAHGREWLAPVRKSGLGKEWQFRRGFVESVKVPAWRFVEIARKLFELAPITSVYFPEASNEVRGLAGCPELARLRRIDLRVMCICGGCPIHDELEVLLASPQITNLTHLVLTGDRLTVRVATALAASPYLSRLTALDLSSNLLQAAGVRALASSTRLPSLSRLQLVGNDLGLTAMRALAGSDLLAGLTQLDLAYNKVGDAGAKVLAGASRCANLTLLDLGWNGIGPPGAHALAESPHFSERLRLRLGGNNVGDAARALRRRFQKRVSL
jgi:uncharacterized protein (TIGR02996 family)